MRKELYDVLQESELSVRNSKKRYWVSVVRPELSPLSFSLDDILLFKVNNSLIFEFCENRNKMKLNIIDFSSTGHRMSLKFWGPILWSWIYICCKFYGHWLNGLCIIQKNFMLASKSDSKNDLEIQSNFFGAEPLRNISRIFLWRSPKILWQQPP